MKSAFVAIVGRPSSGKSTFINYVCGHKVSIVSATPQTTRNRIRGIVNRKEAQLVFVDTPGYHRSEKKFNNRMKELVDSLLEEIDLVLYLIDGTRSPGEEEEDILEALKDYLPRVFIGINKSDAKGFADSPGMKEFRSRLPSQRIHEVSALTGEGVEELLLRLVEAAPQGEAFYPPEYYTDQEPLFRAGEIIREKAIQMVKEEVPHAIYVEIADAEEVSRPNNKGVMTERLWLRAFLTVERESQKGILIGAKGKTIKTIRFEAERELRKIFPRVVDLDLQVKVHKKWRSKDPLIRRLVQ